MLPFYWSDLIQRSHRPHRRHPPSIRRLFWAFSSRYRRLLGAAGFLSSSFSSLLFFSPPVLFAFFCLLVLLSTQHTGSSVCHHHKLLCFRSPSAGDSLFAVIKRHALTKRLRHLLSPIRGSPAPSVSTLVSSTPSRSLRPLFPPYPTDSQTHIHILSLSISLSPSPPLLPLFLYCAPSIPPNSFELILNTSSAYLSFSFLYTAP